MDAYERLANAIVVQAAEDYLDLCAGFILESPPQSI